jgi:hypothetical protein
MANNQAYLLKLNQETNELFKIFDDKLGWGKRETIIKLLFLFSDVAKEMTNGRELLIQVSDETDKEKVFKKMVTNFNILRNPS